MISVLRKTPQQELASHRLHCTLFPAEVKEDLVLKGAAAAHQGAFSRMPALSNEYCYRMIYSKPSKQFLETLTFCTADTYRFHMVD